MTATKPRNRALLLVAAILALLLAAGFTISDAGVQWFWTDAPWVGAVLVIVAVALAIGHFLLRSRRGRMKATEG